MKIKSIIIFILSVFVFSCSQENTNEEENLLSGGGNSIIGQWFLIAIGDTDVSSVECYQSSYLEASQNELTFYIQDRQENGSCITVLNETLPYTEEEGFYYIDEEAIEIYIEGNTLTWRVDFETTLVFLKD